VADEIPLDDPWAIESIKARLIHHKVNDDVDGISPEACVLVAGNWLWVFQGGRIWPQAAAVQGFQPAPSNRVMSSFLEGQNGWKPRWASDSHAIGAGAV
jgi:hypothetical protein